MRTCTKCGEEKTIGSFGMVGTSRRNVCKECINQVNSEYRYGVIDRERERLWREEYIRKTVTIYRPGDPGFDELAVLYGGQNEI